jgi:hypothetical protein
MSAITDLVGGIVAGLGKTAIDIRTAITGVSPEKAAELQQLALNLEAQKEAAETALIQAQADINKVEAASPSKFVSWWRPAVAWVCVCAFALNYLIYPLATWGLALAHQTVALPQMDIATMVPILVAMLGLGAYRTIEKSNGSSK